MPTRETAKQVAGIWLPGSEVHLVDMLLHHSKVGPVDGKGTYQLHKLRAALAHQPTGRRRVAVDIGAHVGLWSMHLVKAFAHVHAFEPIPPHGDLWRRNVAASNATLHRTALGARSATVAMEVPEETTGNGHVVIGRGGCSSAVPRIPDVSNPDRRDLWLGVPMRTLDSFALEEVDFIKIDVEGFERPVIEGAVETILRYRPHVVVEQKGNETAYGEPRNAAVAFLRGLGMAPVAVISGDWILGW